MTRNASRLALTAVAAVMLTAGCTSQAGSTAAQHSSTTAPAPTTAAPSVAAVQLADLLSAPVPELCEHEPGNLVNGQLPNQDPHNGQVRVARKGYPDGDYWVAFGDLTGDGVEDGALVTECSAGGVPWAATVQLYAGGPTRLGGVDLSDLTHGREVVTGLSIADGIAHVSWLTQGPDDPECCGTVRMTADLRWDGSRVVTENVQRIN
ncbi:hypothetical protein GGC64_004743 [Mycobacterium sp. OAS707]|uniref:hypothetical protein n=1 Tax=Mycobacterium sp. OAS707 TaxID=2663822 RepID=UPI00178969CF|nr:hypothetical protein [Mycobacterium sp. OAS707]MBE1550703.1 hypothetical protein [Mycobacterium sp. OAS707]